MVCELTIRIDMLDMADFKDHKKLHVGVASEIAIFKKRYSYELLNQHILSICFRIRFGQRRAIKNLNGVWILQNSRK